MPWRPAVWVSVAPSSVRSRMAALATGVPSAFASMTRAGSSTPSSSLMTVPGPAPRRVTPVRRRRLPLIG
jgi:hypothetical protein